jgi:hypothetical protein
MADSRDRSGSSGSALLLSAMTGAVLGAAGFGWWLLSEADRRRRTQEQLRSLRLTRLQGLSQLQDGAAQLAGNLQGRLRVGAPAEAAMAPEAEGATVDDQLHAKVQQLNQAIDEVRRQLEQLQPQA